MKGGTQEHKAREQEKETGEQAEFIAGKPGTLTVGLLGLL